ncbi:MAG: ABC1 kinase family protein [Chloroflexota bacterium]
MIRSRYRRITFFFARLLTSLAFWELLLPRLGLRSLAARTRPVRLRRAAVTFRALAIQMGGVLIKVGQFLSARVDVLPPEFTQELAGLQDEVPAAPFAAIRRAAEAELGGPLEKFYTWFDPTPLAAASLGQVHRAHLSDGGASAAGPNGVQTIEQRLAGARPVEVVVKVLRPDIERVIETDLAALRTVGGWLHRYPAIRRRANVPALLTEFTRILLEEIDYLAEGRNAERFAANFKEYAGVRVPRVHWSHTTRRTLTLENVLGIKITDYEAIGAAGISRADVASRLLDTYLKQIFIDGFFHADPHPGNLFVEPGPAGLAAGSTGSAPPAWELTFIDFGMVGTVPDNLRDGLREMVIGVGTQDAARVVRAYQMMDMLLPDADTLMIERAGSRVFERYWGKNMTELTSVSIQEMQDLADEFRELLYSLPFQVPQNVIFLARCVNILSGMCTGLDPHFNLWAHLAPFARKLMAEEVHAGRENWLGELEKTARAVISVPQKMDRMLARLERGDVAVRMPELHQQVQRLEHSNRQLAAAIVFAALLLGGLQVYLAGIELPGLALLGGAGIAFLRVLFARVK